jgi:hypothetical protein
MMSYSGNNCGRGIGLWSFASKSVVGNVLLVALVIFTGCRRQAVEPTNQQLAKLSSIYNVPWPTNYNNEKSAYMAYSALDSRENIVAVTRLELDEASFQLWRALVANRMKEYRGGALDEDKMSNRFPWYNPQAYPASQTTQFFCETKVQPYVIGQLTVYAVRSNGVCHLFIHSWTAK